MYCLVIYFTRNFYKKNILIWNFLILNFHSLASIKNFAPLDEY